MVDPQDKSLTLRFGEGWEPATITSVDIVSWEKNTDCSVAAIELLIFTAR
jgi:hypothetical protein